MKKKRAAMIEEWRQVDEKLGPLSGPSRSLRLFARWVFRLAKTPVYLGRIARNAFVSFDQLLEKAE